MRALEVENNLNLKAVQLTKSGLRVFGFCPAGATIRRKKLVLNCLNRSGKEKPRLELRF